jgi:hypothetical protein
MTEKPPVGENAENSGERVPAKIRKPRAAKPKKSAKSKKPATGKNKGGRPAWQPSIEDRTTVEQMKYVGDSDAMIARALKIDVDTLRKHCAYELENGYANRRKQVIGKLFEAAESGNVSAIKRLDEMGKVAGAAESLRNRGSAKQPEAKAAPKAPPPGKKEQLQQAAESVTGIFAAPAPPKLVVNNAGGK